MKDSKEYSKKIQKLFRELKQKGAKSVLTEYDEPVDALIYAVVSEQISEGEAIVSIKRLKDYFIDWNDLRVASIDEITEVLGPDIAPARSIATTLVNILKAVFEKYNMLTLQPLKKLGKRPAKQVLEKFTGVTPFVVDYLMLTSLQGHAIPLTPKMMEYLKANGLAHNDSTYEETEGFLARQIPMKSAYEFYVGLRNASESPKQPKTKKKK